MNPSMHEADRLYEARRYREAISVYRSILREEPSNLTARASLARSLHAIHNYEACEMEIGRVLEARPDLATAHVLLGRVYYSQHQYQEGEAEFRRAIELDSTFSQAYVGLSTVWTAQKKLPEALSVLKQALEVKPGRLASALQPKRSLHPDKATRGGPSRRPALHINCIHPPKPWQRLSTFS